MCLNLGLASALSSWEEGTVLGGKTADLGVLNVFSLQSVGSMRTYPSKKGLCRLTEVSLSSPAPVAGYTEFSTAGACWILRPSTSHPAVTSSAVLVIFWQPYLLPLLIQECSLCFCSAAAGPFCAGKGNISAVQRGVEQTVSVDVLCSAHSSLSHGKLPLPGVTSSIAVCSI